MTEEVKCVVCGRKRTSQVTGHFIDGSWENDKNVPEKYRGKWVCSYACYEKLFPTEIEKVFVYRDIEIPYPPELVKLLTRYTDEEIKEIADKESESTVSVVVNEKEKTVKMKDFCSMILNKQLTEKDITDTAKLYIEDLSKSAVSEQVLRILAAGLDKNLVLITEKSVKTDVDAFANAFTFELNFALDEINSIKGDRIETHYIFVF